MDHAGSCRQLSHSSRTWADAGDTDGTTNIAPVVLNGAAIVGGVSVGLLDWAVQRLFIRCLSNLWAAEWQIEYARAPGENQMYACGALPSGSSGAANGLSALRARVEIADMSECLRSALSSHHTRQPIQ